MTLKDCFNVDGNFIIPNFDPYRKPDDDEKYDQLWNFLFYGEGEIGTYGQLREELVIKLHLLVHNNNFSPFCDAVKLMWSRVMGSCTDGSYPAIYMWR